ncbi:MAG: hypothetical protein WCR30_00690 [Clostridia bacterium]
MSPVVMTILILLLIVAFTTAIAFVAFFTKKRMKLASQKNVEIAKEVSKAEIKTKDTKTEVKAAPKAEKTTKVTKTKTTKKA